MKNVLDSTFLFFLKTDSERLWNGKGYFLNNQNILSEVASISGRLKRSILVPKEGNHAGWVPGEPKQMLDSL